MRPPKRSEPVAAAADGARNVAATPDQIDRDAWTFEPRRKHARSTAPPGHECGRPDEKAAATATTTIQKTKTGKDSKANKDKGS
jgi:hypothetical protein